MQQPETVESHLLKDVKAFTRNEHLCTVKGFVAVCAITATKANKRGGAKELRGYRSYASTKKKPPS